MEDQVMESTVETEEVVEEVNAEEEEAKLRQERISACNREITSVLEKYGCTLDAVITLRAGQVIPGIKIVPIELMRQSQPQPV